MYVGARMMIPLRRPLGDAPWLFGQRTAFSTPHRRRQPLTICAQSSHHTDSQTGGATTAAPRRPLPLVRRGRVSFSLRSSFSMAPVVVPYDSPQPRRSRSTSRLSSGLQAVEHLSQDAEEVAKEVEKVSRVSERFAEDYQDAYPDAWLNQPVSSAGARSSKPRVEKSSRAAPRTSAKAPHRSTSHREDEQTTSSDDDSEVEVWSDPPSPKKQSAARRTKVSEGSQTPRRNLMGRVGPLVVRVAGSLADVFSLLSRLLGSSRTMATKRWIHSRPP